MSAPFIYDVTLRDGNQALKKPWNFLEKAEIFNLLCRLGVQGAEIGYAGASEMDFQCCQNLAQSAPAGMVVGVLARANDTDIQAAIDSLKSCNEAAIARVHTFIGMSPYHMENVLRKSPDQVLQMAISAVKKAKEGIGPNGQVQFSPEHFGDCMENIDWVVQALVQIAEAGADVINLPNTVERTRPTIFVNMVSKVVSALDDKAVVAVHCHDDLGMATATTVESFFVGATQLEVTLNGIGERAGNTNLYEVAVALQNNGVKVNLNFELIYQAALQIAEMSNIPIPDKAPLIGPEVLKHRSGIHQHGTIRTADQNKGAYRPVNPELIGRAGDEECEFTSQSGAAAVGKIVREGGRSITDQEARLLQPALKAASESRGVLTQEQLVEVYDAFKDLESKKKVGPQDLLVLAEDVIGIGGEIAWELKYVQATSGNAAQPNAMVCLIHQGREYKASRYGDGPVDAAFKAIKRITEIPVVVQRYQLNNVSPGADSQASVVVRLSLDGKDCEGKSADTDVVHASVKAYMNALNRLLRGEQNGLCS